MDEYKYYKAADIADAVKALNEAGGKAIVLAGGTDVMVDVNHGRLDRGYTFVYIGDVPGLSDISESGGVLEIGCLATASQILESSLVQKKASALWLAAKGLGGPQVRNRATIGGNIMTANPSGDFIPALIALGAEAKVESGGKRVKVEAIPTGVKKTSLASDEIITGIDVPLSGARQGSAFVKIGKRKAMTISVANAAVWVELDEGGETVKDVRIAVGCCAPTVVRIKSLEAALTGAAVASLPELSMQPAEGEIKPRTSKRATMWYRSEIVPVLIQRAVMKAVAIANGADPSEEVAE